MVVMMTITIRRLSMPRAVTKGPTAVIRQRRRRMMEMARFSRFPLAVAVVAPMTIMTLSNDKEADVYEGQG